MAKLPKQTQADKERAKRIRERLSELYAPDWTIKKPAKKTAKLRRVK